jgi:hypothetical protein
MPYNGEEYHPDKVFQSFDSAEEMFAAIAQSNAAADAQVQPWQRDLAPGDFFLTAYFDVLIYNEVLEDKPEPGETPLRPGMRVIRAYSQLEDRGELGYAHVSTALRKLSQAQFEKARELGWPSSERELVQVLLVGETGEPGTSQSN